MMTAGYNVGANARQLWDDTENERQAIADVGKNFYEATTAVPRALNAASQAGIDAVKGAADFTSDIAKGWRGEAQGPSQSGKIKTAAVDTSEEAQRKRIDAARGDVSDMPTYQPGYKPPSREEQLAAQQAQQGGTQQEQPVNRVSYDPEAAAKWRAERSMGAIPTQAGGDALSAVRDYIKQISTQGPDPSKQSFGEMSAATAQSRRNARALNALTDMAKTEFSAGVTSRENALNRANELDKIGVTGAETRATKEFEEGLGSTKALTDYRSASAKQAGLEMDSKAFELSQAGKKAAMRDQIAAMQAEGAPPAKIAALQRQYATYTDQPTPTTLDTQKALSEMYAKEVPESMRGAVTFDKWRASRKFAEGGMVEGYAEGGAIPAGYGDVPQMPNVTPFVNDYRRYAMMTQRMGATPVDMEQFAYMRGAAKRAQALQPGLGAPQQGSQMGMQAFADGGMVEAMTAELETGAATMNNPLIQRQQAMQTYANGGNVNPPPMASEGREFSSGSAIPVAGKKVLGPGTGTSDSIPAIIDGERPAALSTGEYVIPAEVVRAKGTEFFDKLLAQYKGDKTSGA